MESNRKLRDLIKPQRLNQDSLNGDLAKESLVVPYCSSSYSKDASGSVRCGAGYSDNAWCTSKPTTDEDEILM